MSAALLHFGLAAAVIIVAGTFLVRFADRIADETGWGRVLVGSILLAGATSLPELMVDLNAVLLNQPDLAVGDLLGSSLLNLFILALIDSISRHPRRAFTREFEHHAQTAALSINLTALVGIGILSRLDTSFLGVGLFAWIVGAVYLVGLRLTLAHPIEQQRKQGFSGQDRHLRRKTLARAVVGFAACAWVILLAAPYLVRAADRIAEVSGLGHTFVGTTLIALATSLPELIATLAAFRMGAPDLALGNIFGSNTFNMVLPFPLDVFFPGALLSSVRSSHALTAFCVVAVSSVAVMGQMSRKR
jgi:cation:H+ antiporter